MILLKMPALGQVSDEFTIFNWKKQIGDEVKKGDVLLEVQTDKAVADVESYADGILVEILYKDGDLVEAGDVFAKLKPL